MTSPVDAIRSLTSNGKTVLTGVLIAALAGVTVLAALHDIDSQAVVAIYSAIIGASVGHLSGQTIGRMSAELEQTKSAGKPAGKGSK